MTDQLSGMIVSLKEMVPDETYKSSGMRPVLELEVETVTTMLLSNTDTLCLGIVLHDHLLEEQKGSLMVHSLSNLNLC